MPRNLVRRVELMTPILEKNLARRAEQILLLQLKDNQLRWELGANGGYKKVQVDGKKINNHKILENYITKLYDKTRKETPDYVAKLATRLLKDS
jgi:polyphosphate kinase